MVIRRIGPISCAKIAGTLYAIMGLVVGGIVSLVAMAGGFGASAAGGSSFPSTMIGAGSIVVFPIMYGCFGFVGTLIAAALYNVLASAVGGVEIDMQ